jgi:hypothetical protein
MDGVEQALLGLGFLPGRAFGVGLAGRGHPVTAPAFFNVRWHTFLSTRHPAKKHGQKQDEKKLKNTVDENGIAVKVTLVDRNKTLTFLKKQRS